MRRLSHTNGNDALWLIDEVVPIEAAVVDDVVVGFEDAIRQPVAVHELPDVLDRVELGASRWQRQQINVWRHDEVGRTMPSGLLEDDDGVGTRRDVERDLVEMYAHCLAGAARHDDADSLAFGRADCTEDPCRGTPLIARCRGTRTTPRPAPGEPGLLSDPGFILPPQLYGCSTRETLADLRQTGGKASFEWRCRRSSALGGADARIEASRFDTRFSGISRWTVTGPPTTGAAAPPPSGRTGLAANPRFDPAVEEILVGAAVIEAIYADVDNPAPSRR
jgi:hypothetical protein